MLLVLYVSRRADRWSVGGGAILLNWNREVCVQRRCERPCRYTRAVLLALALLVDTHSLTVICIVELGSWVVATSSVGGWGVCDCDVGVAMDTCICMLVAVEVDFGGVSSP